MHQIRIPAIRAGWEIGHVHQANVVEVRAPEPQARLEDTRIAQNVRMRETIKPGVGRKAESKTRRKTDFVVIVVLVLVAPRSVRPARRRILISNELTESRNEPFVHGTIALDHDHLPVLLQTRRQHLNEFWLNLVQRFMNQYSRLLLRPHSLQQCHEVLIKRRRGRWRALGVFIEDASHVECQLVLSAESPQGRP